MCQAWGQSHSTDDFLKRCIKCCSQSSHYFAILPETIISINWLKRSHPVLQPLNGWDSLSPHRPFFVFTMFEFNHTSIIVYSSFDTDASLLFESLGWKNLSTQRNLQKALLVYKSIHSLARSIYFLNL